ncbi:GAF domain-containing protein [Jannaschia sp. KMU-145]|uniref:GAF domain-containing protein n=1 Tax=Jannaschia halovivens TaxID=3388667 RepID=UPI00396AF2B5
MQPDAFDTALSKATTPDDVYAALMALTRGRVPARLFTIMTVDLDAMEARRAFTSHPEAYPTSGTKPIEMNDWFARVVTDGEVFVAQTLAEIAQVFPDHALIGSLGCGAVVNLPVVRGGTVGATVNILDAEGSYSPKVVAEAEALIPFAARGLDRIAALQA